jgi:hypothetical protein
MDIQNGGLGDYQALTPHRTVTNETRALGPLQTPIVMPPGIQTQQQILAGLFNRLDRLPFLIVRELRKSYRKQGRDGQDFILTSAGQVTLTAGAAAAVVVSLTVQQNFEGALHHIGTKVIPAQGASYIKWSMRINNTVIHPGMNQVIFMADTLSAPLPFEMELLQMRVIELIAENTHATDDIDVCAVLLGSTSFMADWKNWGDRPLSGIG